MNEVAESRSLLDIHSSIIELEKEIEYNGGEITDEIEIKLSELQIEEKTKILSVAAWNKKLEMEIEGVELHKKDVDSRLKSLKNLKERLRRWIFKGSLISGSITGNDRDGWQGETIQSDQIKISWRKSEETILEEDHPTIDSVYRNFPHFFDYKIRVNQEGGEVFMDLVQAGLIEIQERKFRKSIAADYLKKSELPLAGIKTVKKLNPQIK